MGLVERLGRGAGAVTRAARGTDRFLLLYALAYAGAFVAFVPVLGTLLPMRIEAIAGEARIGLLSIVAVVGAGVASVANIGFGMCSDLSVAAGRSRRGWTALGLLATILSFGGLAGARTAAGMVAAVVAFQFALNMLMAPLLAMLADEVPDARKGLAAGVLACAVPCGSAVGVLVTSLPLADGPRFAIVAACVGMLVAPVLLTRPRMVAAPVPHAAERARRRGDLLRLSGGRLLIQIAGNTLFAYPLFFFERLTTRPVEDVAPCVASLTTLAVLAAVPLALGAGRWSDRLRRRKPFLAGSVLATVAGLVLMAARADWTSAAVGYAVFACGGAVLLNLQATYAIEVLPSPTTRGRDLGVLNLGNTLPALAAPALTWSLVGDRGFSTLFLVLAALVATGGVLTLSVRSER